jgi:hypothetical protein
MDLTDRERRVYTAALMGLVRTMLDRSYLSFVIGDDDVTETFDRLRFTHRILTWESTEDCRVICKPRDPDAYWTRKD